MAKMIPVVVLVEEAVESTLTKLCEFDDVAKELEPLQEKMNENGWTSEMLMGGMLLTEALQNEVASILVEARRLQGEKKPAFEVVQHGGKKNG